MDRGYLLRANRMVILGLLVAALTSTAGCQSALFTLAYLIKGNDIPPECDILKEKKVVVVCRPVVALQYRNARVDRDLAERVSSLLKTNVKKIKMVEQRKVAKWLDENSWDEFLEVGQKMEADYVIGIDLVQFDLQQGQTLYQGRATTEVKVIECKTGKVAYEKSLPQVVYPPNRMIPTSDKQENDFRKEFVGVLADRIGWNFYAHDRYDDFAADAKGSD
jgi:ABC-type uncharacterized transport system auxiliary subunit